MGLTAAGLTKRYGRLTALDRVSLSLREGEVLGLIGPNGAGKTTLFECLAGLVPVDGGAVSANGVALDVSERARHLFYLPDGITPWPTQTVRWAIDFTLGFFAGVSSRTAEVVNRLDLSPDPWRAHRYPLERPTQARRPGNRPPDAAAVPARRRAVRRPRSEQGREVASALRAHAAGGRTLFLSIHQIHDAARICDRFVLLSGGQVRGEGTIDELSALAAHAGSRTAQSRGGVSCPHVNPPSRCFSFSWARNAASSWRHEPGGFSCSPWARSSG